MADEWDRQRDIAAEGQRAANHHAQGEGHVRITETRWADILELLAAMHERMSEAVRCGIDPGIPEDAALLNKIAAELGGTDKAAPRRSPPLPCFVWRGTNWRPDPAPTSRDKDPRDTPE